MSVATRIEIKGMETKKRLIKAALHVFAKKGFNGSTIRDIAQQAGVTEGLIYRYFKSKEELLKAVIQRYSLKRPIKEIFCQLQAMGQETIEVVVGQYLNNLFRLLYVNKEYVTMVLGESQRNPQLQNILSDTVDKGIEDLYCLLYSKLECEEEYLKTAIRNLLIAANMYFFISSQQNGVKMKQQQYISYSVKQFIKAIESEESNTSQTTELQHIRITTSDQTA